MPNKPGAGRPRTKDGKRVNVYLSKKTLAYLSQFDNQSEILDNLVREKMNNDYYEMYANQAAPADLIALGREKLIEQIRELNPEEDAETAADAILATAELLK